MRAALVLAGIGILVLAGPAFAQAPAYVLGWNWVGGGASTTLGGTFLVRGGVGPYAPRIATGGGFLVGPAAIAGIPADLSDARAQRFIHLPAVSHRWPAPILDGSR